MRSSSLRLPIDAAPADGSSSSGRLTGNPEVIPKRGSVRFGDHPGATDLSHQTRISSFAESPPTACFEHGEVFYVSDRS